MSQAAKKVCMTADVEKVLDSYPAGIRKRMEVLRNLILRTAARTEGVGVITETLKWGEPAYLTEASKSGSTIRMGWKASSPDHYALYFNCRTTLVDTFRTRFPELKYEGNRAILLEQNDTLPRAALVECIEMALTYHRNRK